MQNANTTEPDIAPYAGRLRELYGADPGMFTRLFPDVDMIDSIADDRLLVGGALMSVSYSTGTVEQANERLYRLLWSAPWAGCAAVDVDEAAEFDQAATA